MTKKKKTVTHKIVEKTDWGWIIPTFIFGNFIAGFIITAVGSIPYWIMGGNLGIIISTIAICSGLIAFNIKIKDNLMSLKIEVVEHVIE